MASITLTNEHYAQLVIAYAIAVQAIAEDGDFSIEDVHTQLANDADTWVQDYPEMIDRIANCYLNSENPALPHPLIDLEQMESDDEDIDDDDYLDSFISANSWLD